MAGRTPHDFPGELLEEGIILDPTNPSTKVGEIRYATGSFSLYDAEGEFNPRSGTLGDEQAGLGIDIITGTINVDDSQVPFLSGATFSGAVEAPIFSGSITGSHTEISLGVPAFIGQGSITITTQSSGQVIFSASNGAFDETEHENLDTLTHFLTEDSYDEVIYAGSPVKISQIITWDSVAKTSKIKEQTYSYTSTRVTEIIEAQFNALGNVKYAISESISYVNPSGNKIANITRTRNDY